MENEVAPYSFTSIIAAFVFLLPRQIFIHDLPKKPPPQGSCDFPNFSGRDLYLLSIDPKLRPLSLRPSERPRDETRRMAPSVYLWDLNKGINPRDTQRRKQPPSLG